jgi:hypothetical protein
VGDSGDGRRDSSSKTTTAPQTITGDGISFRGASGYSLAMGDSASEVKAGNDDSNEFFFIEMRCRFEK